MTASLLMREFFEVLFNTKNILFQCLQAILKHSDASLIQIHPELIEIWKIVQFFVVSKVYFPDKYVSSFRIQSPQTFYNSAPNV